MMNIVFDADILSTFAKVDAIHYLGKLFTNDRLLVTPAVYTELKVPKEYGYDYPDQIFNSDRFELVQINGEEINEFKSKLLEVKSVHSGELEAIIIAKKRGFMFSSNDIKAQKYAVSQGVSVLYFHSILRALWKFGLLTQKEVRKLIGIREIKDNMEVRNTNLIFD